MDVSVLGFGGAEIGYESASLETVEKVLHSALDAGLNVIDTAECYMNSEELLGAALKDRRNDYFLFTKCGHEHDLKQDWSRESLQRSIDRSLQRLQTDCVDLISLHSCTEEELRKGVVIEVLQKAREQGKTRFIGYSGDRNNARYAVEAGVFDSLQTSVNIADQESIHLTIPLAREKGMGVIAKRPIANAAWKYENKPENAYHQTYWERLQKLQYPFLKTPEAAETALRFTLSVPGVDVAIVGTKQPDRWQSNAELVRKGALPAAQFAEIQKRFGEVAGPDWVGQV